MLYKLIEDLKVKREGGDVKISGYASTSKKDDYGDVMQYDSVDLSRFDTNPIMLFNHNPDYVIGKWIKTQKDEKGLIVEGVISNSDSEKIKYVRDLISEGVLKTLSIGFVPNEEKQKDGANAITNWKLYEVSVVAIPANDEATFSLSKATSFSKKMFEFDSYPALKSFVLKEKGAMFAALVSDLANEAKITMSEYVEILSEESRASVEIIADVLAGNTEPTEEIIVAIAKLIGSEEALREAAMRDKEEQGESESSEDMDDNEMTEEEKNAFQDCVAAKIPKLLEEGKTQEEASAIAMNMCREGKGCKPNFGSKEIGDPTANVTQDPPMQEGSAMLDTMRSLLSQAGAISMQLQSLIAAVEKLSIIEKPNEMGQNTTVDSPKPESTSQPTGEKSGRLELIGELSSILNKLGV